MLKKAAKQNCRALNCILSTQEFLMSDQLNVNVLYWFRSSNKPTDEVLSFFTFGRDRTRKSNTFTARAWNLWHL